MVLKSQKDFFAGLLYATVGAAFALIARNYTMGTGARMGPAYFPTMLGLILLCIGVFIMLKALRSSTDGKGDKIGSWGWRPLFFVLMGNVSFGALLAGVPSVGLPAFGLIVATYALVFIAALAGTEFKLKEIFVLATVLAVGSYLAFVKLLNLQFPVWPAFITG